MTPIEIAGTLFTAAFTSNAVLAGFAGLDSAERFSRSKKRLGAFAVLIAASAIIADIASFILIMYALPKINIASSTLTDGTVAVLASLFASALIGALSEKFLPGLSEAAGGETLSVGYNSAVVGIVLLCRAHSASLEENLVFCIIYTLAVLATFALLSVWRDDIKEHKVPRAFSGAPILFVILGLAAMVLHAYAGIDLPSLFEQANI